MKRSLFIILILFISFPGFVFAQASVVRDYVGLINQSYHPGIVSFFEKIKKEFEKQGDTDAVKLVDIIIKGGFGSGFLYSDARGNFYVITNNHVIAQAHSISITFERTDGSKRRIDNLKLIATDVDNDLAIMSLPPGERPLVAQGMAFINRAPEEGEEVFSAGFPGLGITPLWQFGNGRISNVTARFPKSINDETLLGPFIQHTAQVDMGNSGGPLLVAQRGAPSGYAVAGINTLSATRRQAANYAIPPSTFQPFITSSLNPNPQTYKAALDARLAKFIEGLGANSAVYTHISEFLSTVCIGENVEYAYEEMWQKANNSVKRTFSERAREDLIAAMGISVAWTIENSIRSGASIKASIKEITGAGEEYTVVFTINNKDVESVWIREYGNWRIKTFGKVASGDTELVSKREKDRKIAENLRISSESLQIEAGYANLFDKAPSAFYACLDYYGFGFKVYYASSDFSGFGFFGGFRGSIKAGDNFGIMPYFRFGFDYYSDKEYEKFKDENWGVIGFPIALMGQVGVKLTTSAVPGLFIGAAFQYNLFNMMDDGYKNPLTMTFALTAGYTF